jgi:hemolysin III
MPFFDLREPVSAWSHCAGLVLALPGTLLLWRRSTGDMARRGSLMIYGFSIAFCYAASTLYHGLYLPGNRLVLYDRLDRIGIFVFIAGSYTPMAWILMRGRWRWCTLATVWLFTAATTALLAIGGPFPPPVTTGLYLGMGWGAVACCSEVVRVVSHRALLSLVVGGLSYSVGAVLNLLHWPHLYPGVFGPHELFHLFVLAGSLAHYRFIFNVVPLARGDLKRSPAGG